MRSIYQGKAEEVLSQFPDACFDALVVDPPSEISFIVSENDTQYHPKEVSWWKNAF